jgi:hypothetical protein
VTYKVSTVVKILACNTYILDHISPLPNVNFSMVDSRMLQNKILTFQYICPDFSETSSVVQYDHSWSKLCVSKPKISCSL